MQTPTAPDPNYLYNLYEEEEEPEDQPEDAEFDDESN
jgi:hypothetical protein